MHDICPPYICNIIKSSSICTEMQETITFNHMDNNIWCKVTKKGQDTNWIGSSFVHNQCISSKFLFRPFGTKSVLNPKKPIHILMVLY